MQVFNVVLRAVGKDCGPLEPTVPWKPSCKWKMKKTKRTHWITLTMAITAHHGKVHTGGSAKEPARTIERESGCTKRKMRIHTNYPKHTNSRILHCAGWLFGLVRTVTDVQHVADDIVVASNSTECIRYIYLFLPPNSHSKLINIKTDALFRVRLRVSRAQHSLFTFHASACWLCVDNLILLWNFRIHLIPN